MIIIGEKINGAIPSVGEAIKRRDRDFIVDLVKRQLEADTDYLDVCAGTAPEEELEAINWLIDIVQAETDCPMCIDSPDPKILEAILPRCKTPGLINSVSGEGTKCEIIFPLMEGTDWSVVALTCDDSGIPTETQKKVEIAVKIVEKAAKYGITPDRIFVDTLVMSLATVNDSMLKFMEAVREIKRLYPTIKTTSGLSNISYGMPYRKVVNQNFLTLALSAGMDSGIVDPTNRDFISTIYAAEALLGMDKHCRKYNKAFRAGKIGPIKK